MKCYFLPILFCWVRNCFLKCATGKSFEIRAFISRFEGSLHTTSGRGPRYEKCANYNYRAIISCTPRLSLRIHKRAKIILFRQLPVEWSLIKFFVKRVNFVISLFSAEFELKFVAEGIVRGPNGGNVSTIENVMHENCGNAAWVRWEVIGGYCQVTSVWQLKRARVDSISEIIPFPHFFCPLPCGPHENSTRKYVTFGCLRLARGWIYIL